MCQTKCKKLTSFGELFHVRHSISLNYMLNAPNYLNRAVPMKTTCPSRVIPTVSIYVLGFLFHCDDLDPQLVPRRLIN